jgi:hypothetical protein
MATRRTSAQIPDVSNSQDALTFDQRFFYQYGKYAVKNITLLTVVGLGLGLILCMGLVTAEVETDAEELWVEKGTRLAEEKDKFDKMFGGHSRAVSENSILESIKKP